jgi:hypothetical protein
MDLRRVHQFEWLEARNMLNGNPLVDLPQLPPSGAPDSQVVHAAPGNPSEVTVQTPIANTSAECPPQGNPFSDNAFNEALQNYLNDHSVQTHSMQTQTPGPELPGNAVRIPDQGSILIGGVVDNDGGNTAQPQPATVPDGGTLLLGGIKQPSESHGDGSLLIMVTPRIVIQEG